jgi:hypothetical protein
MSLQSFKNFFTKKPIYISRPLINKNDIRLWAATQGFITTVEDMHVTEAFSKTPIRWSKIKEDKNQMKVSDFNMKIEKFGDAYVLSFKSQELENRFRYFRGAGCSYDHGEYIPHITISYKPPKIELKDIKPYNGVLIFGPEKFKELDLNWKQNIKEV